MLVAFRVVPMKNFTVEKGSAVPVKVGVVLFVTLSEVDEPLSLFGSRSGADGTAGATVSMTYVSVPIWDRLLAASLAMNFSVVVALIVIGAVNCALAVVGSTPLVVKKIVPGLLEVTVTVFAVLKRPPAGMALTTGLTRSKL
jgi:hypothetical protein